MSLDLYTLKNVLVSSIQNYVYPRQLDCSSSISLYSIGTIVQPFYPFSSGIINCSIYCKSKIGSPGPSNFEIWSQNTKIFSSTLTFQEGWNTIPINLDNIVSKNLHYIKIYGGVDSNSDIYFGMSPSPDKYFYGNIPNNNNLAFSVGINDFVYTVYPLHPSMKISSLPIVVIDVVSRPGVRDVYLVGHPILEIIQVSVDIYSKYPDEIDRIAYGIERGLVRDRFNLTRNVRKITPIGLSDLSFISPEIFFRTLRYNIDIVVY